LMGILTKALSAGFTKALKKLISHKRYPVFVTVPSSWNDVNRTLKCPLFLTEVHFLRKYLEVITCE
jgi:hypothetical protein